ncbi:MAG: hypothetical protein J2P29_04800 [Actinobacteria bacterium]|nr:hypothetical protein [Actinomycetota bacterium]
MPRRLRRFLLYPLAAALPAAGLMLGLTTSAGAATAAASPSAAKAAAAKQAAVAAIRKLDIGQHGTAHRTGTVKNVNGLTQVQSTNWAGYADTGSGFSKVSSSWTEPSASCSNGQTQLAAFWVGIDGYSSGSVEQDGTMIECYQHTAYQYSWWEMYPTNAVQVVGSTVAAGDKITATVTRSGTSYALAVTDSTHSANSFTTTQSCSSCANTSAEWIAEAPSGSSGVYPLAHFSTWTANSDSVTEGSTAGTISSFTDDELTMVNNSGAAKATPGALNSSGNSFSVTWDRSS